MKGYLTKIKKLSLTVLGFLIAMNVNAQTILGGGGFGTPTGNVPAQDDLNKNVIDVARNDNTGDIFSVTADGIHCIPSGDGTAPVEFVTNKVPSVLDVNLADDHLFIVMPNGETFGYEETSPGIFVETQYADRAGGSATAMSVHDGVIWHTNSTNRMYIGNNDSGPIGYTVAEMDNDSDGVLWFIDTGSMFLSVFNGGTFEVEFLPPNTVELDTEGLERYIVNTSSEVFRYDSNGGNGFISEGVLPVYLSGFQMVGGDVVGGDGIEVKMEVPAPPLAITLRAFDVEPYEQGKSNSIIWVVDSQKDNDFYTVQRSVDAINFTDITIIDGNGTSNHQMTYEFIDSKLQKDTYYYRLSDTDYSGLTSYSNIVYVENPLEAGLNNNQVSVDVHPNPSFDGNYMLSPKDSSSDIGGNYSVFDAIGRLVQQFDIPTNTNVYSLEIKGGNGLYKVVETPTNSKDKVTQPFRIVLAR